MRGGEFRHPGGWRRLSESCDEGGQCTGASYDLAAQSFAQSDPTSRQMSYTYDGRGNVLTQTDGLGHTTTFEYDADDNLTRAEGPDGSVVVYTYDGNGNMLSRLLPHEVGEDPADFLYTYTYNEWNERETVTLPTGGVIDYDYDATGNLTTVKDGDGNVIESRAYNADGTMLSRTDRFGTVTYQAYEAGQPTQILDPFGETIGLVYDGSGNLLSRTERGETSTFEYDSAGRILLANYTGGDEVPVSGVALSCSGDRDCDTVPDAIDNCPDVNNPEQQDSDAPDPAAHALYRFEEPDGSTAVDEAGGHDATLSPEVGRGVGFQGSGLRG